jgi:hypothetical protein
MHELKYKDIRKKIIGASFEVHKFLGNGFQGIIYQRALYGGDINAKTKEGEGSEFIIQLPV